MKLYNIITWIAWKETKVIENADNTTSANSFTTRSLATVSSCTERNFKTTSYTHLPPDPHKDF